MVYGDDSEQHRCDGDIVMVALSIINGCSMVTVSLYIEVCNKVMRSESTVQ